MIFVYIFHLLRNRSTVCLTQNLRSFYAHCYFASLPVPLSVIHYFHKMGSTAVERNDWFFQLLEFDNEDKFYEKA